jgi:hypothetical protein
MTKVLTTVVCGCGRSGTDDGEVERTKSKDKEEQAGEATSLDPEELETPNPEPADDANNMEVDIVPITLATVVADITAGNAVIEFPSTPPASSLSCPSRRLSLPSSSILPSNAIRMSVPPRPTNGNPKRKRFLNCIVCVPITTRRR